MKTLKILSIALMLSNNLIGQDISKLSIELGIGTQFFTDAGSEASNQLGGDLTARYMLNNKFGFFARTGLDILKSTEEKFNSGFYDYVSENLHGGLATNTGRILGFEKFTKKFTIINTFGAGYTKFKSNNNPHQSAFSISFGTQLLYKIDRGALKLSYNRIGNIGQNWTLDRHCRINSKGIDSYLDQFRIGVVAYIFKRKGKEEVKKHYDWHVYPKVVDTVFMKPKVVEKTILKETPIVNKVEPFNEVVFFDENKHNIKDTSLNATLKGINYMIRNPKAKMQFVGYACTTHGSDEYNMLLSEKRAKEEYDKFISAGISKERLSYIGKGKDKRFVGKENSDLAKRVEFIVK